MRTLPIAVLVAALVPLAACGEDAPSAPAGPGPAAAAASRWHLAADPGKGAAVRDVVAAGAQDEVLVAGRVQNVVRGFAAFKIVDLSIPYCGEGDPTDDHCPEPWDFCCHTDELPGAVLPVSVRGADGEPVSADLPELRSLDLVVVRGRVVKDQDGQPALVATGWFRRDRPQVPASVKFE